MKITRKLILLSASLLLVSPHVEAAETLSLGPLGQGSVERDLKSGASIAIRLPGGGVQREEGLGEEFVPFLFEGKETKLETVDLDGDGIEEIIVRGSIPPISGALLVFRFDGKKKQFLPVLNESGDDFLPVDLAGEVKVSQKGVVEAKVLLLDAKGDRHPVKKRWKLKNGKFQSAD